MGERDFMRTTAGVDAAAMRLEGAALCAEGFAEGKLAMLFVGLLATWIPARRALAVDPLLLMRED